MSSNIRVQKVCEACKREFTAKTTVTRCCSDRCAKRLYKHKQREKLLVQAQANYRDERVARIVSQQFRQTLDHTSSTNRFRSNAGNEHIVKELLNVTEMAFVIGLSKRSFQRMLAADNIPRLRLGKRILFDKETVLSYLNQKHTK